MSNVFTITTELKLNREYNQLVGKYIFDYIELFNKIQRLTFHRIKNYHIKNGKITQEDRNIIHAQLKEEFNLTSRAIDAILSNMLGRYESIKELKEFERKSLERKIFNLEKGSLVTVGARPSMGKTAFGLNVVYRVAKEKPALYINLEMSRKQIINRLAAINSGVEYRKVERKTGSDEEITRINMAMSYLNDMNLKILDVENPDFKRIVNQIRRLHQRKKFDVIVIDYLTLMQSYGHQNKNLEVEYMSNRLKLLAKELDTCIIILAQLNRGVEARTDKRPILSDLRDSGGIEQASNVVAFLHREDYYDKEKKNIVNSEVEFIVRKNRSGELGTVHLGFHLPTQRMVEKRRG